MYKNQFFSDGVADFLQERSAFLEKEVDLRKSVAANRYLDFVRYTDAPTLRGWKQANQELESVQVELSQVRNLASAP